VPVLLSPAAAASPSVEQLQEFAGHGALADPDVGEIKDRCSRSIRRHPSLSSGQLDDIIDLIVEIDEEDEEQDDNKSIDFDRFVKTATFRLIIEPFMSKLGLDQSDHEYPSVSLAIARTLKCFDRHINHNTTQKAMVDEIRCWKNAGDSIIDPVVAKNLPDNYNAALIMLNDIIVSFKTIVVCPCERFFFYGINENKDKCGHSSCNLPRGAEGSRTMRYFPIKERIERLFRIPVMEMTHRMPFNE
jgi:hypothetical protein